MNNPYYSISQYYKDTYGEKVYKLPVKLSLTCPNRDGAKCYGGCIFCGETGGSFENLPSYLSVDAQLSQNKDYIGKRYKANKFIAYFQNFTNTYMSLDEFKEIIRACEKDYIVGVSISTRSDSITEDKLIFLKNWSKEFDKDIIFELGLQTANYKTLDILNRGETLADFIEACNLINKYGFRICTHVILSLPWDDIRDVRETARIINALNVKEIKIHSLFVIKGTKLYEMYQNNEFIMPTKEEYIENVIEFLRIINSDVAVQRLVGRAPEEETAFCNWDTSWWLIRDEIIEKMNRNGFVQGDKSQKVVFNKIKGDM
ncbi:TIGR01212 family radical SAM protein [Anaerococcus sp. Marseille-Q7828]|uniref:TIGR01212 family radical SAM protein n=1 Tax=Anaerococcus sp. Marseille-Q7828 TaxID=3036300 RepID=UPI0024ACE5A4|nr:TIGR01212 family radical SAM protein [Anaerococcus sp. Marseille-Q7828]